MNRVKARVMFMILLACLICSCAGVPKTIEGKVSYMQKRSTTGAEVMEWLGSPNYQTLTPAGKIMMTYVYLLEEGKWVSYEGSPEIDAEYPTKTVQIYIGADGTVENVKVIESPRL